MGRDFRKLIAWQKADDLAVAIYQATRDFPKDETYGLRSQMRRAAVSIAANIAEGCGKRTLKDRRASFDDSMGESNELEYYIHLACRLNYYGAETETRLEALRAETAKTLDGLMKLLNEEIERLKA